MPGPVIAALIEAIGSMAAAQMGKQGPAAPQLPNGGGSVNMQPTGPPSAMGRTLEDVYTPAIVSAPMADVSAPAPIAGAAPPVSQTPGLMPIAAPTSDSVQKVEVEKKGTGINGLDMAQLGLMLGGQLFARPRGPAPPGLPGGASVNMRPVFRG
jgi:hypothetical protein